MNIPKLGLPALEPMALRKKIIHLVPTLERGGSEMSQLRMLPYLNDEIESIFITLKQEGSLAPKFREKDIAVMAINQKGIWDLKAYVRLFKLIRLLQSDLIVTHLIYADIVGRFFVQWITRTKVISSLATTYNFPTYWPARLFERLTKYLAQGYIANAEIVKTTYIEKLGVSPEKIHVLTTGMDLNLFQSLTPNPRLRTELEVSEQDVVIICVANLHINKGHRYLLEAFEELFTKHRHIRLLLVGDGTERKNLEAQCQNYHSRSHIQFLGKRSDVPDLLALSNIFSLPTFFEGMCNAIMEGMAMGLPIVTTHIPENQELVTHGKNGLLVPVKDTSSLRTALEQLIQDKHLRETMGQAAQKSMQERYNLPDSVDRWRTLLTSLAH